MGGQSGWWARATCETLERRILFAAPSVTGLALINADTDQPVTSMPSLTDGAVIDFSRLPTRNLNVVANVGTTVPAESVRFGYDSNASYRVENGRPYAFASDNAGDYFAWTPAVGAHTIRATAFTGDGATGTAGNTLSVRFTVTNGAAATAFTAASAPVGTTGLRISWPARSGAARYRVSYVPGKYIPGAAGAPRAVEVAAPATSLGLSGLASFTL